MGEKDKGDVLTIKECAEILRCSLNTFRGYIAQGKIDARRLSPRVIRIRRSDLDAFIQGDVNKESQG